MAQPGRLAGLRPAVKRSVDEPDEPSSPRRVGVTVGLDLAGSFPAAAEVGNAALLRALTIDPAVVRFDLSRVTGALDGRALRQLLDTGGLLEHWPGTAVVLVTSQPVEDELLARYSGGRASSVNHAPADPTSLDRCAGERGCCR